MIKIYGKTKLLGKTSITPIVPPSTPTWTQVGASIPVAFGSNIAMNHSGDRIIVGEGNDDRSKIFSWNGTLWNQMGNDINGQPNSSFGRRVVMNADGDLIAISSPLKGPDFTGAVKSYSWDGSSWVQFGQELIGGPNEFLGSHISMDDGNFPWLAVTGNFSGLEGYVKTYEANGPQWYSNQQDIILSDDSGANIHLNGNSNPKRIAVGEPYLNLGGSNLNNSGVVTIYSKGNGVWDQIGQTLSGIATNEYFGSNVILNDAGDRLFITSRYYNNSTNENGRVYTYSWNNTTSTWVQLAPILTLNEAGSPREADKFCQEISINSAGNRMVLASDPYTYYDPSNGQILNGDVRTYQFNGSSWVKIGQTLSYKWDPDSFGTDRVAMNSVGDKIAICSTEDIKVYSL